MCTQETSEYTDIGFKDLYDIGKLTEIHMLNDVLNSLTESLTVAHQRQRVQTVNERQNVVAEYIIDA